VNRAKVPSLVAEGEQLSEMPPGAVTTKNCSYFLAHFFGAKNSLLRRSVSSLRGILRRGTRTNLRRLFAARSLESVKMRHKFTFSNNNRSSPQVDLSPLFLVVALERKQIKTPQHSVVVH
jgi:hypothetical protein